MRQVVHNSAALTLAIILLCVPARSQSVPNIRVSANDLARRVITNELKFQDDHTNWMYRLEKEQYGKKQVEEIIETKEFPAVFCAFQLSNWPKLGCQLDVAWPNSRACEVESV